MIIYSTPNCGRCQILKDAFQKAGMAYTEAVLDATILARCLCETSVWVQAAPLVLDGVTWHFFDDFFDASGNLLPGWLTNMKGIKPHKAPFSGKAETETKKQECKSIWSRK